VIFLIFTVIGSAAALGPVIDFSDSMIFLMSIPNLIGLYLMAKVVRSVITSYYDRVQSGEVKEYAHR
jgi:AGCS family alanine or glycine:cation symporter